MDQEVLIRKLKQQLLIERIAILLVLLVLIGRWGYGYFQNRHYAIVVDGSPVVVLATSSAADRALMDLKRSISPSAPGDVTFAENVTVTPTSLGEVISEENAAAKLKGRLTPKLMKFTVLADNTPIVAVDTEQMAGQVLEGIKQRYGSKVKHLMEEPEFKQRVSVRRMAVDGKLYCASADDAVDAATSGTSPGSVYTVSKGDLAGSIAGKFHMKLADLQALNGGKNLDKLQIGDRIRVSMKEGSVNRSKLTVVVRDQEEITETVPFQTQLISTMQMKTGKQVQLSPGRNGKRHVVRAVTYENGVRTGMEVVEEKLIRKSIPRKIAVGIKG